MAARSHHEILVALSDRIELPEHHTVGAAARTEDGIEVPPTDPRACAWCLLGALRAELAREPANDHELHLVMLQRLADAAAELWPELPHRLLPALSDDGIPELGLTGHQAVRLIVDRAVENCPA